MNSSLLFYPVWFPFQTTSGSNFFFIRALKLWQDFIDHFVFSQKMSILKYNKVLGHLNTGKAVSVLGVLFCK